MSLLQHLIANMANNAVYNLGLRWFASVDYDCLPKSQLMKAYLDDQTWTEVTV